MRHRQLGLWIEVVVCLGWATIWSTFGLAMTAHWIVTTLFWGADIPAASLLLTLYALGTGLGIVGTATLLKTQLGTTAKAMPLRMTQIGLIAGIMASLFIPGGERPANWRDDPFFALFGTVLPCLCFAHFVYLGRKVLLPSNMVMRR